jgi:hypothetical protein
MPMVGKQERKQGARRAIDFKKLGLTQLPRESEFFSITLQNRNLFNCVSPRIIKKNGV